MPSLTFKLIIVGDVGVGKSCILKQLTDREFDPFHPTTIGLEYGLHSLNVNGKDVKLELWDTAGQECYMSLTKQYFRNADGCLVVFDITRKSTLGNVKKWMEHARSFSENPDIVISVVGNKADIGNDREVSREEGQKKAKEVRADFWELTAKDNQAVEQIFQQISERIFSVMQQKSDIRYGCDGRIKLATVPSQHGSYDNCCPQG